MSAHIPTWQKRAEMTFKAETASLDQKKTETVMDAMRAEIADLRAALQAQQGDLSRVLCELALTQRQLIGKNAELAAIFLTQQGEAKDVPIGYTNSVGLNALKLGYTAVIKPTTNDSDERIAVYLAAPAPATLSDEQLVKSIEELQRFEESCMEGGGVDPDEEGRYILRKEVLAILAAAGSSQGQDGKDAARYRWLRSNHSTYIPATPAASLWGSKRQDYAWKSNGDLDAAIDAALAAKEAK